MSQKKTKKKKKLLTEMKMQLNFSVIFWHFDFIIFVFNIYLDYSKTS